MNHTDESTSVLVVGDVSAEFNVILASHSDAGSAVWKIVPLSVLITWTLGSNGLVAYALLTKPALRTPSNLLIGHQAAIDFFIGLFFMTLSACKDVLGFWPFSIEVGVIWLNGNRLVYTASVWSTTSIAIDRYTAIAHPKWYLIGVKRKMRRTLAYYALIWTVSFAVWSPSFLMTSVKIRRLREFASQALHSKIVFRIEPFYATYVVFGSFLLPLLLMVGLYGRMLVLMRKQRRKMEIRWASHKKRHMEIRRLRRSSSMQLRSAFTDIDPVIRPGKRLPKHQVQVHSTIPTVETFSGLWPTECAHKEIHFNKPILVRLATCPKVPSHTVEYLSDTGSQISAMPTGKEKNYIQISNMLDRRMLREQRAIRLVVLLITLLGIAWIPHTIAYLSAAFTARLSYTNTGTSMFVQRLLVWNGYTNVALNPIAYALFNRGLREVILHFTNPCECRRFARCRHP